MAYNNSVEIQNPEIIPKLIEVLDLVLESETTHCKTFSDVYTFNKNAFHKKFHTLGRRCVSLINECLLNHRFDEATKLLWIMCQDRSCFDLVLYKGTMVVLQNLLSSDANETVKKFSNDITGLRYLNKLEVQIEYLIYTLKNNIHDVENLSESEDKNQRGNHRIHPYIHQIYSAYCALLNYIKWLSISQNESSLVDDKNLAFNIISSFKKLLDHPGTWDIFVLKLIEMLEHYEEYEELEEILTKYVECNPEHVNAYIYLCVHLHKYKADSKIFIQYAKVLANLCPSDERVLLLVQVWNEQGKKLKKRLKILFMYLDYPVNGRSPLGWQMLSSHLQQAVSSDNSSTLNAVKSFWSLRCSAWDYIHFLSSNINSEDESFELISYKVKVLTILEPSHEYIQKADARFQQLGKHGSAHNETALLNSEDFRSLYHLHDDIRSRECL